MAVVVLVEVMLRQSFCQDFIGVASDLTTWHTLTKNSLALWLSPSVSPPLSQCSPNLGCRSVLQMCPLGLDEQQS